MPSREDSLLSYQQSGNYISPILKSCSCGSLSIKMTYASQKVIPFVSELRATGHGEVWDHTDEKKFQQFGWRCTNTESSYNTSTLIGNWNEQRFDINRISKPKPIPSQVRYILKTSTVFTREIVHISHESCRSKAEEFHYSFCPGFHVQNHSILLLCCLNLQYNHYFETTYGSGYNILDTNKVPAALKHLEG